MNETNKPSDWNQLMADVRREQFVGREDELERLRAFFDAPESRLFHVIGPGGIGKTALLQAGRDAADREDIETGWVDASYIRVSRTDIEEAFADRLSERAPTALFVDEFHALEDLFPWLRREYFPRLPVTVRIVTASRRPLPANWTSEPGWRQIVETLELGRLDGGASRRYLQRRDVPESRRADVLAFADGHPLSLAVAAAAVEEDPELELGPAAGFEELDPLVADVRARARTEAQRDALGLVVLVRRLREDLLAEVLGVDEASEQIRWLGRQPFVDADQHGLHPHRAVRRLLLDDFLRYDPRRVERLTRRAQDYYASHAFRGDASRARTLMFDSQYITRVYGQLKGWEIAEQKRKVRGATEAMIPACRETIASFESEESADLFVHWRNRQPDGLRVLVDSNNEIEGFAFFLDVDPSVRVDDGRDPVVDALCAYLDDHPLDDPEHALLCRFWGSIDAHQQSSPIRTDLFAEMSAQLALPPTAVGVSAHHDAQHWRERDDNVLDDFGTAVVDSDSYVLLGHDWRERSREAWFRRKIRVLTGRLDGPVSLEPPWSPDEIEPAVRDALKNYHRGDALLDNPLVESEPVQQRCDHPARPEERERALREFLQKACRSLGTGGDDAMHIEILERTYLDPEQKKQLAVASEMEMAYSTFRKHLREATDRVVERIREWLR